MGEQCKIEEQKIRVKTTRDCHSSRQKPER